MWWYSKASKLSIKRKILVNKCILENTNIAVCTEHFYDANVKRGGDVDNYLKAVRQHEKMHSDLVKGALPGNDPAKKMEALLYDKTENNLKKKIDKEIKKAEDALDKATKDPLDEIWSGTLFVPDKGCNWISINTGV